jgi:hypothetical protein
MEEIDSRNPGEFSGYLGAATMVVLLALAAENLSEGNTLAAMVLAVIAIGCFFAGASLLVKEFEHGDDSTAAR